MNTTNLFEGVEDAPKRTNPFKGRRPPYCKKADEDLEISDFVKAIKPLLNGNYTFNRIPIRRRKPEEILTFKPIKDPDDLEKRIRCIVDWYRDMMPDNNIVIDFGFQALTDEEMDALLASGEEGTLFEVERK